MLQRVLTLRVLFRAFALVLASVMLLAPKGTAPLLAATAVLALLAVRLEQRAIAGVDWTPVAAAGLLLAWAALASSWSYHPGEAFLLLLRVAALAAAGFWLVACAAALSPGERRDVAAWLLAGGAAALALLLTELLAGYPLSRWLYRMGIGPEVESFLFNRATTYLAILAWPLTLALWRAQAGRRCLGAWALLLPAGLMLLLLPLESLAAVVGLGAGLGFFALTRLSGFPARALLTFGLIVGVATAPLATSAIGRDALLGAQPLPGNALHRLYIWSFTGERILERPLLGWGFDASRDIPNFGVAPFDGGDGEVIAVHPHNAVLQVWLELGLVGAALLLVLLLLLVARLQRLAGIERALAQAMLVSALVAACASFGLWQNHWVATLFICPLALLLCRDGIGAGPKP